MEQQNTNIIPEDILKNLRQYPKHVEKICLECGYKGLMGIKHIHRPWYNRFWFRYPMLVLFFLIFNWLYAIGFVVVFVLLTNKGVKTYYQCPSCDKELTDK